MNNGEPALITATIKPVVSLNLHKNPVCQYCLKPLVTRDVITIYEGKKITVPAVVCTNEFTCEGGRYTQSEVRCGLCGDIDPAWNGKMFACSPVCARGPHNSEASSIAQNALFEA